MGSTPTCTLKNYVIVYHVYILQSQKNFDIYVGSCENVGIRLDRHNSGKVRSTKGNKPWKILEIHNFFTRAEAVNHERFLKTGQQKEILVRKYKKK